MHGLARDLSQAKNAKMWHRWRDLGPRWPARVYDRLHDGKVRIGILDRG